MTSNAWFSPSLAGRSLAALGIGLTLVTEGQFTGAQLFWTISAAVAP